MSIHADSPGTSKSREDFFPAHSQSPKILATFLPYQNSPTLWGYLDTPNFFQTKTGISVSR